MKNSIELSSELIKFKSITPDQSNALDFLKRILEKYKFDCYLLKFGKDKIKNLYACYKGGNGPTICFAGHTDVVPPGDLNKWKHKPFDAVIENNKLYGRGASDMKSAIASFISATQKFLEERNYKFNGTLAFLITADEEGVAEFGTKSMIKWLINKKKKIDYCLVGEPTNPKRIGEMIKIGRRGSINFSLKISGSQGHVAYPDKADNPIDIIPKIFEEFKKPFDNGSEKFQPTNLVITSVDADNKIANLIPSFVNILFNVRFNDKFNSEKIIKVIHSRIKKITKNYILTSKVSGESFINYSEFLTKCLTKSIKKVTNTTPELSTSGGTSDARFISEICPVLEFGSIGETMHKTNEMVRTKDIEKLSEVYYELLKNFFDN